MKILNIPLILLLCSTLIACHSDRRYSAYWYEEPSLVEFNVIDSYGKDSGYSYAQFFRVNPYVNAGGFEVYWQVDSEDTYEVEMWLGDSPNIEDSLLVYAESCGDSLEYGCGNYGSQNCQLAADYTLSCGDWLDVSYIGNYLYFIPQPLYLFFQVCDEYNDYCEYDSIELLFE